MDIILNGSGDGKIAEINSDEINIKDTDDTLDLIAGYSSYATKNMINL
jgi:hypothetical protein